MGFDIYGKQTRQFVFKKPVLSPGDTCFNFNFPGAFLFTNTELTNIYSLIAGIRYFIVMTIVVYGTALALREIMRSFGYRNDSGTAFKIVSVSVVPLLLCQIVSQLFESFIFVNILAFFGLYILYTGIERMISPRNQTASK